MVPNTNERDCNQGDQDEETFRNLLSVAQAPIEEPPAELVERVREKLRGNTAELSSHVGRQPRQRRRRPVWIAASALAIAILVMIATLIVPRQATWAQVANAVRAKPWILFTYPSDDGQKHQEWISISRDMSARRDGDRLSFHDHRLKLVTMYDSKERTIIRGSETPREWKLELNGALDRVFQAIFRGAAKLESPIPEVELAEQKQTEIERGGRKWLAYELTLRHVEEQQALTWKMTFLVDPVTRLPQVLLMMKPQQDKEPVEYLIEITYPDPGPVDIYDLGAPRDAMVIDKLPSDDVQRLVAGIKASAERFGDYFVMTVNNLPASPWYVGTPMAEWQQGKKSRNVMGVVDMDAPPVKAPAADIDEQAWWRKRWTELIHVPSEVYDGRVLWTNQARSIERTTVVEERRGKRADWPPAKWTSDKNWPGIQCFPLFYVYPDTLTVDYPLQARVDPHPSDGPAGTVRLTVGASMPDKNASEDRMWIDRERSYLVLRREIVGLDISKTPPVETFKNTFIVEKMERSPRGIWYPTVMRIMRDWEENGQKKTEVAVTRHYFDFDAKFSNDLFKPIERPGETLE